MATAVRRRRAESFEIHEDVPSTEDTQMNEDIATGDDPGYDEQDHDTEYPEEDEEEQEEVEPGTVEQEQEQEPEPEEDDTGDLSDDDAVEESVKQDMVKLQNAFSGFRDQYRLIKRIGEGTFSTVYKAEDIKYDDWDNWWDPDKENAKWTPPPMKPNRPRRRPKYVAIKKIYATSSPIRILNELELLHALRRCPSVCPLITAFRAHDQVVAVLPYFRHADFREYFRDMTMPDTAIYLRSLFTALAAVHEHGILHRDIKPTNFLYDPATQRGVLVDFGLAEREGADAGSRRCLCHDEHVLRRQKLRAAVAATGATGPATGYPKEDRRPSRRANRAGTRGFRAPEVLFKCTEQTPKIDVWSAGVILLTIMSKRFPFFNSADDVEALIEIATIFGQKRMKAAAQLHGCMFETSIPTIGSQGFSLSRIILWSTCREQLEDDEKVAVEFLERCMELDPSRRISAAEALEHEFFMWPLAGQEGGVMPGDEEEGGDEEMDVLTYA